MKPGIGMHLEMDMRPTVTGRMELEPPDRDRIKKALMLWETHPHLEMNFPLAVIVDSLCKRKGTSVPAGAIAPDKTFNAEFVKITQAEINQLDPEENYGVLIGDMIFISDAVPEEYYPMVIANLGFLKHLGENEAMRGMADKFDTDVDTTRHWSANMLDILLAEQYFAEDPEEYKKFLAWRKKIERTDFFRNGLVDDFLRKETLYKQYKRTTHPMERAFYAKRSWELGGLLSMMGQRAIDENARMIGVSIPDVIIRKLCDVYREDFDPEYMSRLIDFISEKKQKTRHEARDRWKIDLKDLPAEEQTKLASQAELLTRDAVGDMYLLEGGENHDDSYLLKPFAAKSFEVLKDRIVFFLRKGLLDSGLSRKLLAFTLKCGQVMAEHGPEAVEIMVGEGKEETKLRLHRHAIGKEMEKIQAAMDRFIQLRIKFTDLETANYIPGQLEENYRKLLLLYGKYEAEMEKINEILNSLDELAALMREQRSLLQSTNLLDADVPLKQLKTG